MVSEEKWPKVAIIVLNWNGWRDTIECLESLYQITYPNYEVIVVDNGSQDESIRKIKEYCEGKIWIESHFFEYNSSNKPIKVIEFSNLIAEKTTVKKEIEDHASNRYLTIIKNEKNYGFAKGNNIGFAYAINNGAKYLLTLNNDTVAARDFLDIMIDLVESDNKIGIAGPACYYYDDPDIIWSAGLKINWWTGAIHHVMSSKIIDVDSVSGCAMIINYKLLKQIYFFNTKFPFGNEDYELCTRAIRNHFRVAYVPNSKVWHKISKSREKLMTNTKERKSLLGNTGNLRLKDKLLFFKVCAPSKLHYLSMIIFFIFLLPVKAFKLYRRNGFSDLSLKARLAIMEMLNLINK